MPPRTRAKPLITQRAPPLCTQLLLREGGKAQGYATKPENCCSVRSTGTWDSGNTQTRQQCTGYEVAINTQEHGTTMDHLVNILRIFPTLSTCVVMLLGGEVPYK